MCLLDGMYTSETFVHWWYCVNRKRNLPCEFCAIPRDQCYCESLANPAVNLGYGLVINTV